MIPMITMKPLIGSVFNNTSNYIPPISFLSSAGFPSLCHLLHHPVAVVLWLLSTLLRILVVSSNDDLKYLFRYFQFSGPPLTHSSSSLWELLKLFHQVGLFLSQLLHCILELRSGLGSQLTIKQFLEKFLLGGEEGILQGKSGQNVSLGTALHLASDRCHSKRLGEIPCLPPTYLHWKF